VDCHQIARWNGSAWQPLGSGMNSTVVALTAYNDQLIAGGDFSSAGEVACHNIALWDGSAWQPLGEGLPNWVEALAVYNDELIAGGLFTTGGDVTYNHIAQWDGSTWRTLGTGLSGVLDTDVFALTVYSDELIAGGQFATGGDNVSAYWARWYCDQPRGACCFHDGHCEQLTQQRCMTIGEWWEQDRPCEPNPCVAAGDLNCDGLVNDFDITPFVKAITNPSLYEQLYPGCDILNGDGRVNNFDITPFVHLLTGP
jgi:hypothetical protein